MKYAGEFFMLSILVCLILFFLSISLTSDSSQTPYAFVGLPEEYVFIYQKPSTRSSILGKSGNGELVSVLEKNHEWCLIETEKGLKGFVFKHYLDLIPEEKF
jgi:uncharacterized protein YgiM (DUF1202 family)